MQDTIGSRLRAARQGAGLSVVQLSEAALGRENNARQIYDWEKGDRVPSIPSLYRMAAALGVHVHTLIPDTGPQQ